MRTPSQCTRRTLRGVVIPQRPNDSITSATNTLLAGTTHLGTSEASPTPAASQHTQVSGSRLLHASSWTGSTGESQTHRRWARARLCQFSTTTPARLFVFVGAADSAVEGAVRLCARRRWLVVSNTSGTAFRVTSTAVDPAAVRLSDALLALKGPGAARQAACVELRPDGGSQLGGATQGACGCAAQSPWATCFASWCQGACSCTTSPSLTHFMPDAVGHRGEKRHRDDCPHDLRDDGRAL
jgi:hypothetical protein